MMPIWDDILTPTDREVIRRGGYGKPRGLGDHPALVIIDPQYNYAGADKPILEQIADWPSGVGESAWRAVERLKPLIHAFRERKRAILYTRQVQKSIAFDGFAAKAVRSSSQYLEGAKGTSIVDEIAPQEGDFVIDKSYASAFYGTPLLSVLIKLKVDTLIVTGGTTGGCVRATCVDAISRDFDVAVVEDCVYDRISVSHKVALLDLWMKYCDLITCARAIDYISHLPSWESHHSVDPRTDRRTDE
jgi:nicotinamidase-related amidase